MSISSSGIQTTGSFLHAAATSSLAFQSSQSPVSFSAGQSVISNSDSTSFLSSAGDVNIEAPRGSILLEARDNVEFTSSHSTLLNAQAGGILVGSEPGVISLNAGTNAEFSGTGQVSFVTQEQQFFFGSNELLVTGSESVAFSAAMDASVDGSDSLTLVTNSGSITLQSSGAVHIGASNSLSFSSQDSTLSLSSDTNNFNLFSLLGNTITSNNVISFTGTNQGVSFNSQGTNSGFNINAAQGATYTATGNGVNNGFGIQVGSVQSTSSNSTFTNANNIQTVATGTVNFEGAVTTTAKRYLDINSNSITATADTIGTIAANKGAIYFTANDRALGSGSYSLVSFDSALSTDITAVNEFNIQAGSAVITSSASDISFSVAQFQMLADRGTGSQQTFSLQSGGSITFDSSSSSTWNTGETVLSAVNITINSGPSSAYYYANPGGTFVQDFTYASQNGQVSTTAYSISISTGTFQVDALSDSTFSSQDFTISSSNSLQNIGFKSASELSILSAESIHITSSLDGTFSSTTLFLSSNQTIELTASLDMNFQLGDLQANVGNGVTISANSHISFSNSESSADTAPNTISLTSSLFSFSITDSVFFKSLGEFSATYNQTSFESATNVNFQSDSNETFVLNVSDNFMTVSSGTAQLSAANIDLSSGPLIFTSINSILFEVDGSFNSYSDMLNLNTQTFQVNTNGDLLFDARSQLSFQTKNVIMNSGDGGNFQSPAGSISFQSAGSVSFSAGQNLTVTSGISTTVTSTDQTFASQNALRVGADFGELSIFSDNGATTIYGSSGINILSPENVQLAFNGGLLNVSITNGAQITGGNVAFNVSAITMETQSNINFLSLDNTLGGNVLSGDISNILFNGQGYLQVNALTSPITFASQKSALLQAAGSMTTTSSQIIFTSQPNAYQQSFNAAGNVDFSSSSKTNAVNFASSSDLTITAGGSTYFGGGVMISQQSNGIQSFSAGSAIATLVTNGDVAYTVQNTNLIGPNDFVSIANTSTSVVASTGGISLTSTTYDYRRTPDDSTTNPKSAGIYETVGFSIYTNNSLGNIFIQSAYDVFLSSNSDVFIDAEGIIRQSSTNTLTISPVENIVIDSKDGPTFMFSQTSTLFTVSSNFQTKASRYSEFIASEAQLAIVSQNAVDITAQHGGVAFFAEQGTVSLTSSDVITWTSGNKMELTTKQDIDFFTSAGDIEGFSGVSFVSQSGPVALNSPGSYLFLTGRDFDVTSGGAFNLTSSLANIPMQANDQIYVSTLAGNIYLNTKTLTLSSTNAKLPGNNLLIQSSGSAQTGRDHVFLASSAGDISVFSNGVSIDAVENINIGIDTRPDVIIQGGGDIFSPGVVVDSSGNVLFSPIDNFFSLTAAISNSLYSTFSTSFLVRADTTFISTLGDVSFFTYGTALIDAPLGKITSQVGETSYISGASTSLVTTGLLTFTSTNTVPANYYNIITADLYFNAQGGSFSVATTQGLADIILSSANVFTVTNQASQAQQPIAFTAQNGNIFASILSTSSFNAAGNLNFNNPSQFLYNATLGVLTTINTPTLEIQAENNLIFNVVGNLNINAQTSSISADTLTQTSNTNTIFSSRYATEINGLTSINFNGQLIQTRSFGDINFSTPNEFQAKATENLAFVVGNYLNFTSGSTASYSASEITINSNSTTQFLSSDIMTITSTGDSTFSATQPYSIISFSAGTSFDASGSSSSLFQAGTAETDGTINLVAKTGISFTAQSALFTTNSSVGDISYLPIAFNAQSTIKSIISGPTTFVASGTSTGSGNITMVAQTTTFTATAGEIEIASNNGSVSYYSPTSISLSAAVDIYIQSEATESSISSIYTGSGSTFTFAPQTAAFIESDFEVIFRSESDQINLKATTSITATSTGLGGDNAAGIEFDTPTLTLGSNTFTFSSSNNIEIDAGSISLPSTSTFTINSGADIDFLARGAVVPISGTITGLDIQNSAGVGTVTLTSADTTIQAGNSIIFNGASTLTSTTAFILEANQDIQINTPTLKLNNPTVNVEAGNGIEIELTAGTFSTTGVIDIYSGDLGAANTFSSSINFETTGSMTVGTSTTQAGATGDFKQQSENNFLYKSHTLANYNAPAIQIVSDRNSQLYFSSSTPTGKNNNELSITSDTGGIYVFPYDAVRHRPDTANYKARLSFFTLSAQIANPALNNYYIGRGTPATDAILQPTFNAALLARLYDVLGDTNSCYAQLSRFGVFQSTNPFPCPGIRTKIALIAQALVNYGLLLLV